MSEIVRLLQGFCVQNSSESTQPWRGSDPCVSKGAGDVHVLKHFGMKITRPSEVDWRKEC